MRPAVRVDLGRLLLGGARGGEDGGREHLVEAALGLGVARELGGEADARGARGRGLGLGRGRRRSGRELVRVVRVVDDEVLARERAGEERVRQVEAEGERNEDEDEGDDRRGVGRGGRGDLRSARAGEALGPGDGESRVSRGGGDERGRAPRAEDGDAHGRHHARGLGSARVRRTFPDFEPLRRLSVVVAPSSLDERSSLGASWQGRSFLQNECVRTTHVEKREVESPSCRPAGRPRPC